MYIHLKKKLMIIIHIVMVPDGHRYINGLEWSENVNSYMLILCSALVCLYYAWTSHNMS